MWTWIVVGAIAASVGMGSETLKGMEKDFQSIKAELNEKLAKAEVELEKLRAKAKESADEKHKKAVEESEKARDKIKASVAELKEDSKQNWKKLRTGLAESIDGLNSKIQKALKDEK